MKSALTLFVFCSVLAGGAMADANSDLYLQLKKSGEPIPQWLIDLENPRTPDDGSRTGGGEDFGTAELISALPFSDAGNTSVMANDITGLSCGAGGRDYDAVYSIVPANDLCVNISLCGSAYDTVLAVFENATSIGCNDDSGPACSGSQSSLGNVAMTAGNVYYIVVDGYYANTGGAFVINVTECPPPPTPPANDNQADATEVIVDGDCVTGSTLLATNDNLPPMYQHACYTGFYSATSGGASTDVWHWFTSTGGCYTVALCGSGYDTVLALYEADGTPIASSDDACGTQSSINSYAAGCWLPSGQILVAVDGYGSGKGDYTLCVTSCIASDTEDIPVAFELGKAFPNPFNPSTTINFTMGETAQANLTVYNINGQAVATLVEGVISAGAQSVVFDASERTSGVYFYTLSVGGRSMTEKMILVK